MPIFEVRYISCERRKINVEAETEVEAARHVTQWTEDYLATDEQFGEVVERKVTKVDLTQLTDKDDQSNWNPYEII